MKKLNAAEGETEGEAALDPKALEAIGRALKAHYEELVQAPLPGKLIELLARIEKEEKRASGRKQRNAAK